MEDERMDSMSNCRERVEVLEQRTEHLKHQTLTLKERTHTSERRPRMWLLLSVVLWVGGASMVQAGLDTWTSRGPEGVPVEALAIDPLTPTTLYAATRGFGVFKSTDGGASWSAANTGLPPFRFVQALALDPLTPTTLYAGTGGGVFVITFSAPPTSCVGTGPFRLRGRVRTAADSTGIPDVTVTLTGPGGCQDTTISKARGHYRFRTLGGGTYTVTPEHDGCTFTPPSRAATLEEVTRQASFRGTCPDSE
jgi:hypothetical protein